MREREDDILFSMIGAECSNQVNEKESHLEQRGSAHSPRSFPVAAHPSQVPLSLPQLLLKSYVYTASHVNTLQTDVLQRTDS